MIRPMRRVHIVRFALEFLVLELCSEEGSTAVQLFASHECDLLSVEEFLGDSSCESSDEVTPSVNHNLLFERRHPCTVCYLLSSPEMRVIYKIKENSIKIKETYFRGESSRSHLVI